MKLTVGGAAKEVKVHISECVGDRERDWGWDEEERKGDSKKVRMR